MKWNFYADGYRGSYDSIQEAYDISINSCYEEIKLLNGNISIDYFVKLQQPFSNNEKIGKYIGGMLSFLNGKNFIFKIPPEDTTMHIVVLTHMNDESHYLIRKDVAGFYFGDRDWNEFKYN